jgi:hypothetical protein
LFALFPLWWKGRQPPQEVTGAPSVRKLLLEILGLDLLKRYPGSRRAALASSLVLVRSITAFRTLMAGVIWYVRIYMYVAGSLAKPFLEYPTLVVYHL